MIDVVLFDIGGTILTAENTPARRTAFAKRLRERLQEYGISLFGTDEEIALRLHENAEAYKHETEQTNLELPQTRIWNEFYLKEYDVGEERLAPIAEELSFLYDYERVCNMRRAHLTETLAALHGMGVRMGIISNIISTSFAPHILKEYGVESYMECVVMSSETRVRKPNPEIFEIAMGKMGTDCAHTAYIGDTISRDVRGAKNAALAMMILIENPAIAIRDAAFVNSGIEPDARIKDLIEIPQLIAAYNETHP